MCAALQINNHLQDCGKDYRDLNRVYLPMEALAAAGLDAEALGLPRASDALRGVLHRLAARTGGLLEQSEGLSRQIQDDRLGLEVGVIHGLAVSLNRRLLARDPLSQRVRHSKVESALLAAGATLATLGRRLASRRARRLEA